MELGAAVDVQGLSGNKPAIITNQEKTRRGNLIGTALAAQGYAISIGHASAGISFRMSSGCVDASRRYHIHPNVVGREF